MAALHFFLNPVTLLLLILGASVVAGWKKKNRLSRILLGVAVLWVFIVSISPIPVILIRNLERRYPVFDHRSFSQPANAVHIVVLGAGYGFDPALPAIDQLSRVSVGRLAEAIRIHHHIPASKIVCSAASTSGNPPQAYVVAEAALELNVMPSDTLLIPTPTTTAQEANDYYKRFGNTHTVVLVTCASHMPRALRYFRNKGLAVVPAPANHMVKIDPKKWTYHFKPGLSKIHMFEKALHEYLGHLKLIAMEGGTTD